MACLFSITGFTECIDAGKERGDSVLWNQFNRTLGIERVHSHTHTTYFGAKYLVWRSEVGCFKGTLVRLG